MQLRRRINKRSISWVIDYTDAYKRRQQVVLKGIKDQKIAQAAFCEFRLNFERGLANLPTDQNLTLEEALDACIENRRMKGCVEDWIECLKTYKKHLIAYFGPGKRLMAINDAEVARFRNHQIADDFSVETVKKQLAFLGGAARLALTRGIIPRLPWHKIDQPVDRSGKQTWTYLTDEEIEALLRILTVGGKKRVKRKVKGDYDLEIKPSRRLRAMVIFLLNTGARKGEMFNLMWADVDMKLALIRLVGTKTARNGRSAKVRYIPMNNALKELFDSLSPKANDQHVFGKDGNLARKLDIAFDLAGIRRARIHDLRHTFASHLVKSGTPLYTVSELLGHSSVEMTKRYAHLSPHVLRAAVESLNFGAKSKTAEIISVEVSA